MAGATVTAEVALAAVLLVLGAGLTFVSLPVGGRILARITGPAD